MSATPTLAKSPQPENSQPDSPETLTELVERVLDRKPPQSELTIPDTIPSDEERKMRNERLLISLWRLGDNTSMEYFVGSRPKRQQVVSPVARQVLCGRCEYEHPEFNWGENNGGFKCGNRAVIHHLESELNLCAGHYRKAN
jgi:hypothetical protein